MYANLLSLSFKLNKENTRYILQDYMMNRTCFGSVHIHGKIFNSINLSSITRQFIRNMLQSTALLYANIFL